MITHLILKTSDGPRAYCDGVTRKGKRRRAATDKLSEMPMDVTCLSCLRDHIYNLRNDLYQCRKPGPLGGLRK